MPLIERIKQLLNMSSPTIDFPVIFSGGIIMGGSADVQLTKIIVPPEKICLRFSLGEIVFDAQGKRYVIEKIFASKGNVYYTARSKYGKEAVFEEKQLTSIQCQLQAGADCVPIPNEAEIALQESMDMLEKLDKELQRIKCRAAD